MRSSYCFLLVHDVTQESLPCGEISSNSKALTVSLLFSHHSIAYSAQHLTIAGDWPTCLCLFFLFIGPTSRQIISESTRPIFTKFSALVVVWGGAWLTIHSSCDRSRDVAMAINYVGKFAKLSNPTLIWHVGVPKRITWSQLRCQKIRLNKMFLLQYVEIWRDSV